MCAIVAWLSVLLSMAAEAIAAPSPAAQARFQVALTALHDFEYEDANEGFRQTRTIDTAFALAYWGEALTYYQVLWRREDLQAGRQALARLGPTPAARAVKATTPREKGLLASVDVLFGVGDASTRHRLYADAMQRLHGEYPDDPDIASLSALALMGTVSRSLIGFSDANDLRQPGLAGSEIQKQVASQLTQVLVAHPDHPGALHYLLHAYDDPEHARLALPAARTYAKVAGGSSHALHMPSHVFLQLGLWPDAVLSDRASYTASNAWVKRKGLGLAMRNYHALAWLQYELLQLGRFSEARDTIAQLEPVVTTSGATEASHDGQHQPLLSDLSSMRARYVIETRRWDVMTGQTNFGNVNELFAIGMGAARTGNLRVAEMTRQALADRATAPQEGDLRPAIVIMEREIGALIELANGRRDAAVTILQAATLAELALPPPLGLPAPIKPAPELLGEVLVEVGRPREAVSAFEDALRRNANRSLSVLGLARAARALGDTAAARTRYDELAANYRDADADLTDAAEARSAVTPAAVPPTSATTSRPYPNALLVALAIGGLAAATLAAVRVSERKRKKAEPRRAPGTRKKKVV